MIDIILLAVFAAVTWLVASDGPHGAAITFVSVLLGGLLTMNFFEPVAQFLSTSVANSYEWQHRWDIIAFLGIFAGVVFGLRAIGEQLLPTYAELDTLVYEISRWGFSLLTGYITMAILLTSLHVAPLPREFLGFTPERKNFFQISAPDRQWLALTQYVSEHSLKTIGADGTIPIFDGPRFPRIPLDASTDQIWSSFPIKYAARREQFASGTGRPTTGTGAAPPATGTAPVQPPTPGSPRPGTGTGGF